MDSWSHRPFGLGSPRVPSTSTSRVGLSSTSSLLGSARLSSREMGLSSERFPRTSSTYNTDLEQTSSGLRGSSRDFSGSDIPSTSWKVPTSLTSSSRSYDRPWTESSLSSRRKLADSESRLGTRSSLLNCSDDCDSSRSPLSYSSRGLYSRKSSTSVPGSTKSSNGLSSSRGEKRSDASAWSSSHLWSSRRDGETKSERGLSGYGEGRVRSGLASSLYQPERVTSTYAQGARPKDSTYSPYSSSSSSSSFSSSSSAARESRPAAASSSSSSSAPHRSLLGRNLVGRTTSHYLNVSSTARPPDERGGARLSSSEAAPRTTRFSSSRVGAEAAPPPPPPAPARPAREGEEPGSYRRLLSRLFSRQSSQDSSSGSSSLGSLDSRSSDSADGAGEARSCTAQSQNQSQPGRSRSGAALRTLLAREADVDAHSRSDAGAPSWLPSAPPGRRSPPVLRRPAREEAARPSGGPGGGGGGGGEGPSQPQLRPRRWAYLQPSVPPAEDQDQDNEKEGAVGFGAYAEEASRKLEEDQAPPELPAAEDFTARRRVGLRENCPAPSSSSGCSEKVLDEERDPAGSGSEQERLRKIKERLLLEESDEEEGDLCRICQMGEDSASNPLLQPCHCTGSLQFVHQECIKRWLCSKIHSGTNLESVTTCELCKKKLHLHIDDFDIEELYRTYVQSECENFISSSLHLVGRFFDALEEMNLAGFNLVRILHEQMVNSEVSHSESEGEIQDNRPSIDFSDLEDDSEEEF